MFIISQMAHTRILLSPRAGESVSNSIALKYYYSSSRDLSDPVDRLMPGNALNTRRIAP